jgi:hypothetical protein
MPYARRVPHVTEKGYIVCLPPGLYNLLSKAFTVVAIGFFVFLRTNQVTFYTTHEKISLAIANPKPQTPKIPSVKLHRMEDR